MGRQGGVLNRINKIQWIGGGLAECSPPNPLNVINPIQIPLQLIPFIPKIP